MESLLRDVRFAARGLLRTPGFTVAAVLALGLGMGATTAIFSVVHAVLLRSMGWGNESRLISIRADFPGHKAAGLPLSVPELQDLRAAPFLESVGADTAGPAALQGESAERVDVGFATASFFETLGVQPIFGRGFTPEEDLVGREGVALLTFSGWKKRYGGDPAVLGRSVTIDGVGRTLIGVLPESFRYDGLPDFYLPFGFTPEQLSNQRVNHFLDAVARLRPGVTLESARTALHELSERLRPLHPEAYSAEARWTFSAGPLRDKFTGSSRQPLLLLLGAVFFVLLIACGNVANLVLARSATRERELALRAALGAARGRILRQLLTESLLLSVLGALLGVLTAAWGLDALLAAAPEEVRNLAQVRLHGEVLLFAAAVSVGTVLVFGLAPALRASRPDLASTLKDGGRGTSGAPAGRLRASLVVAQVALSLVLLAGAGLVLRSFASLLAVSPGFEPEGAIATRLSLAGPAFDDVPAARLRYFAEALRRAATLPGVTAAGAIDVLPMSGGSQRSYLIEGYEPQPGEPKPASQVRAISHGYLAALKLPLIAGRDLAATDDEKGAEVALVNEAWVRRYFPGRDGVGRRIKLSIQGRDIGGWRTVVGVIGDTRDAGLDQPPQPTFYLVYQQMPPVQLALVVRGAAQVASSLEKALASIDPTQPVGRSQPLEEILAGALSARRFPLQLLGAFAALAVLLSALGIYGVTSYAVAQRTREFGVRMAIGAQASDVLRLVLGQAVRMVGLGLLIGLVTALAGARLIASQLYGVSPRDPVTYVGISVLLAIVALGSSLLPALRATRIDPMAALRGD